MKTSLTMLLSVTSVGALALFAGCGADAKQSAADDKSALPAGTVVAAEPTNKSVEPVEAVPEPVTPPALSAGVDEIVQLAQAGVGDEVLLAYIENSQATYDLNVEQILYLHDLGVSAEVISAMVRRSRR